MTTLAADMTATQAFIPNTNVAPGFYTLGSELIKVRPETYHTTGVFGQPTLAGRLVTRGVSDTTPAAHAAGATFTAVQDPSTGVSGGGVSATDGTTTVAATSISFPAGTISDLGGGAAGVNLILTRIGPFNITHATPNIYGGSPAAGIADLEVGTVVLCVYVHVSVAFNGVNDILWCSIAADNLDDLTAFAYVPVDGSNQSGESAFLPVGNSDASPNNQRVGIATVDRHHLAVYIGADEPPVAGDADIYAIIAVPAS